MKTILTQNAAFSASRRNSLRRACARTVTVPAATDCPAPAARPGFCSPDFRQHQCGRPNQPAGIAGKSGNLFRKTRSPGPRR